MNEQKNGAINKQTWPDGQIIRKTNRQSNRKAPHGTTYIVSFHAVSAPKIMINFRLYIAFDITHNHQWDMAWIWGTFRLGKLVSATFLWQPNSRAGQTSVKKGLDWCI